MADESQLNLIQQRARILEKAGATPDEIASYVDKAMTEIGMPGGEAEAAPAMAAPSLGEKVQSFALEHINPTKFPVISKLEELGTGVKDAARSSLSNIIQTPQIPKLGNPKLQIAAEAGRQMAGLMGDAAISAAPFTPSEFAMAIGSELLPTALFSGMGKRAAKLEKNIGDEFVKEAPKSRLKSIKKGEPSLGERFIRDTDLPGNTSEAFDESAKVINDFEDQIKSKLSTAAKDSKAIISKQDVAKGFDDVISELGESGVEGDQIEKLTKLKDEFLSKHPETANVEYWNNVKRKLYKLVGDQNYVKENHSGKVQALKAVASQIRQKIEQVVPGIKDLNAKQGLYLRVNDALANQLAKNPASQSIKESLKDRALIESMRSGLFHNIKIGLPNLHGGSALSVPFLAQDEKKQ